MNLVEIKLGVMFWCCDSVHAAPFYNVELCLSLGMDCVWWALLNYDFVDMQEDVK